ncbi:MAG: secretin N-terminal domain-containing protein, partial [Phycisphaerae bacterium]
MRRTSLASNRGRCLWLLAAIAVAAGPIGWPWAGPDGPSGLAANAAQPEQKSMAEQMRTVSPDELAEFKRLAAESAQQATTRPARGTTTQPAVLASPSTQPAAIRPTTRPAVAVSTTQPAAVTAAPQRPQRPFNFNWKDRAWADVIDDFSRMSGRSIIGDSPPAGTVTFRSSRMMSYKEALDVLNVLLFQHNYHLAPVGEFLLLKRLPELARLVPQENFFDSEEAFRSAKVDDGAFVRVLYTPRSGVASELISRARGVVPDYCLIGAVEGANMISITCMARDARKFLDYVHRFERKLPDVRQQRVFKLRYARAREVLTVLQQLVDFGAGGVMRRGRRGRRVAPAEPAAVPVSAAVQEELNWLIVKATPEKLEQIARIIEQIDVEAAAGAVEPEVYKLKHARAEELAGLIGQIVGAQAGPVRARGKRVPVVRPGMATVVAEPRTNSLLVLASQPERKRIAQLIERFDVPLGTERFKRVALQHSRADQMVETLKTLLSAGQVRSRKRPATGPQVAVDPAGNAVLVAGEPEQVNRVLEMIGQLDQKSDVSAMEHIVQLDSARPSALAKVLSQLYDGAAGRRGRASAARSIRFIPFDESNTLVVTAPQKDWQRIESLIQDLDRRSEQIGPAVRTWQMKHADATKVANTLRQMLDAGRRGRAPAAAMVAADERTNTVMARCDRDAGQQIEALIKLLDVPAEQAEPRLIELKYA